MHLIASFVVKIIWTCIRPLQDNPHKTSRECRETSTRLSGSHTGDDFIDLLIPPENLVSKTISMYFISWTCIQTYSNTGWYTYKWYDINIKETLHHLMSSILRWRNDVVFCTNPLTSNSYKIHQSEFFVKSIVQSTYACCTSDFIQHTWFSRPARDVCGIIIAYNEYCTRCNASLIIA